MPRRPLSIAITFDDGPGPDTPAILDTLESHGAVATFFVVGSRVEGSQHVLRRMVAMGCEVGNHTYSHTRSEELSSEELESEILSTSDAIEQATGIRPRLMRPPYGTGALHALSVTERLGLTTTLYTVSVHDWDGKDARTISRLVLEAARPDSVILLHDAGPASANRQATTDALPIILDELARDGFSFVTLSGLLGTSRRARRMVVPRERGRVARSLSLARAQARSARGRWSGRHALRSR